MQWSEEQQRALDAVAQWHSNPYEPVFRLFGYAGTGKTTLARAFAESSGGNVCYGAFTGKAAYVLQQKGCLGATTIHSLIYKPKDRSKARLRELEDELLELRSTLMREGCTDSEIEADERVVKLRADIESEQDNLKRPAFALNEDSPIRFASLVVIDECSMVDARMGEDLLSFEVPILVLGDPAQLPPVMGAGYFTSREPNFMLKEVHRQAQDSPILHLATEVRQGRRLEHGCYGESAVIPWNQVTMDMAMEADQILVGTNEMRRRMNARLRQLKGFTSPLPQPGDRLVCLRNDHEVGLLNGSLWTVETAISGEEDRIALELLSEDGKSKVACESHTAHFLGRDLPYWLRREAQEFDFGYALTVHKAQGSQWDHVLIFDQSRTFRENQRQWLYTAITRAAERVVIAQ